MAKSQFKRNYDNGTVEFPNGTVIDVKTLPENSVNYYAVYGFIRACQDPFGGEKDEAVRNSLIMERALELVNGTLSTERRSAAKTAEEKLEELNEKLESQKTFLTNYIASSDAEKRFAASMGINRSGYEKEIKRLEKAIEKFKKENAL